MTTHDDGNRPLRPKSVDTEGRLIRIETAITEIAQTVQSSARLLKLLNNENSGLRLTAVEEQLADLKQSVERRLGAIERTLANK